VAVNMRRLRLRAVWLLVLPFLWFARPAPGMLVVGAVLGVVGLAIRGWAAGTIHKDKELTTTGPYAFTRNPLYVGSFFLGLGITLAGGHWVWPALFLAFYAGVYGKTMAGERELLTQLFGNRYHAYAANVPAVWPRLTPWRENDEPGGGFTWAQYRRNREWEAALGAILGFGFLAGKWFVLGG
jgi:protein-S-isoprenylcysteine O-methyltransferase Ste14